MLSLLHPPPRCYRSRRYRSLSLPLPLCVSLLFLFLCVFFTLQSLFSSCGFAFFLSNQDERETYLASSGLGRRRQRGRSRGTRGSSSSSSSSSSGGSSSSSSGSRLDVSGQVPQRRGHRSDRSGRGDSGGRRRRSSLASDDNGSLCRRRSSRRFSSLPRSTQRSRSPRTDTGRGQRRGCLHRPPDGDGLRLGSRDRGRGEALDQRGRGLAACVRVLDALGAEDALVLGLLVGEGSYGLVDCQGAACFVVVVVVGGGISGFLMFDFEKKENERENESTSFFFLVITCRGPSETP